MNASFLDYITSEYLKSTINSGVFSRGLSYYKTGRVLNVNCRGGELNATVRGNGSIPYEVVVLSTKEEIYETTCTCFYASDGEMCKHVVAALLKWIEQRNKLIPQKTSKPMPLPRQKSLFNPNDFIQNALSFLQQEQSPPSLLHELLSEFQDLDIHVDLIDGGPRLELKLISSQGDETVFRVSADKSPHIFQKLVSDQRHNVQFSERARKIKVYKTPFVPYLHADINAEGNVQLTPVFQLKGSNKKGDTTLHPDQFAGCKINDDWVWHNNSYKPIESLSPELSPYFTKERPLVYQGREAIEFIKRDLGILTAEPAFKPSERLMFVEIHDDVDVSHVQVETCDSDWLWLDPTYTVGNHTITLAEILESIDKNNCIQKDSAFIEIPRDILDLWQRGKGVIENGRIKMPKLGYLRTRAECGKKVKVAACGKTQNFLKSLDRIDPPQPAPEIPCYKGELRVYQKSGYDWLWFLHTNNFNGILADEMGLGKTHQAMAVLLSALQIEPGLPNLVICPTSVLDHWEAKFRQFAPEITVARFYGKERSSLLAGNLPPVMITTYSILSRDAEALAGVQWNYVVLDEAQKIKNHSTLMCKAAKLLNSKRRLALTGTPIENRLSELWSIFDFLMPGYLGSADDFRRRYETPITKYLDITKRDALKKVIHPFKLRRLKKDVLMELPPKTEEKRYCTLQPVQIVMYRDLIREQGSRLIQKLRDESQPVAYIHIFALLTKLKRLCDHPQLVLNGKTLSQQSSGKFELFKEIMEETLESGEKVVVFSQYLEMLDLIADWLGRNNYRYESLRGSTVNRGEVIERFQTDPNCNVFLGSLMAGGLGIDLTAASVVIHYDRWWNAAREDQATDRVHRIGQTRGVQVFKLITKGTLEEKIDAMITTKANLMNSVVESDDAVFKSFSRNELIELLTF
ncbi:MAG TPA: DEAD/DEAH box helicase [Candidatus Brocadiaceae bacterium]|nr:DEAD/DEAH box helicase [Candidatus Brocadiaceae bacterium]